jgi:phosphoglycolate phosphatase-like HAD superfamily hydrolase
MGTEAASATLASWNDTPTRQAIVEFVDRVTNEGGARHVPPAERVAVFDNDGTLWCEKPMVIQIDFTIRRFAEQARDDPSLRDRQPWKAAHEHDLKWMGAAMVKHYNGDDSDLKLLMDAVEGAFDAVSVDEYTQRVLDFFKQASHPTLRRPYKACGYAPMVELMRYLEANGFATYIASGGDRDFMRPVADEMYGVPPERVIGSALGLSYQDGGETDELLYKSKIEFFDDGPTKPIRIWSRIGRRPILAGGNSNGDIPMLRYAGGSGRPGLRLLLLHDDPDREFDYTAGAEKSLDLAAQEGWTVVSIKNDWSTVFADS